MTLEKAIEILTLLLYPHKPVYDDERMPALHLGIEALKRIKENRGCALLFVDQLLPGETKE